MIPLAAVSGLVCVRPTFAVVNVAPKLSSIFVLVDFQLPALASVYQQHLRSKILHETVFYLHSCWFSITSTCISVPPTFVVTNFAPKLSSFLVLVDNQLADLSCTIHLPTEIRLTLNCWIWSLYFSGKNIWRNVNLEALTTMNQKLGLWLVWHHWYGFTFSQSLRSQKCPFSGD